MRKLIVLLLLCFLGAANAAGHDEAPETSAQSPADVDLQSKPETSAQKPARNDIQSVDSLAEINRSEVLPLVIFVFPQGQPGVYRMPKGIENSVLNDKKISEGTTFRCARLGVQTFFCPRDQQDSQDKCLVRRTFKGSEPLRCDSELSPEWIDAETKCGLDGKYTLFKIVYKICKNNDYPKDPDNIPFYEICYDITAHKTLYTSHEIRSAGLLNVNLLARERTVDMEYPVVISDGPNFSQHPISGNVLLKGATSPTNPSYKLQKIVPPEDMAFATWRKTTYNNLNYEWQHEELIDLWDEISRNIRFLVQDQFKYTARDFYVKTAIVDVDVINSSPKDDKKLPNIWIKMFYNSWSIKNYPEITEGTVILMNNSVDKSVSPQIRKESLQEYCSEDLCIEELSEKFEQIGGAILCCEITEKVLKIFGMPWEMREETKELRIPNVTVTEDQEKLRSYTASERTATLFWRMHPEEMLPLILLFNSLPNYQLPTSISRMEMKFGRIVQGSKFFSKWSPKNIAFACPKTDSDEKCLVTKLFRRLQPLECAKEAVPIVQKMEGDVKCGLNDSGRIYNVVYQICATTRFDAIDVDIYKVCYDKENAQNLFTYHKISPKLISSNLLRPERDMNHFTMIEDDAVPISSPEKNPDEYQLRKLVPSEDMAFGLWKKTTYERINADWQHTELIRLWDGINKRIREHCSSGRYTYDYSEYDDKDYLVDINIYTGVFDIISYESQDSADAQKTNQHSTNAQESNIWIKVIYARWKNSIEAIVILMNNFLVSDASSDSSNSKDNIIRGCCRESLCLREVKEKFKNKGGRIRCCEFNAKIADLFNMRNVNEASAKLHKMVSDDDERHRVQVMRIPGVTSPVLR